MLKSLIKDGTNSEDAVNHFHDAFVSKTRAFVMGESDDDDSDDDDDKDESDDDDKDDDKDDDDKDDDDKDDDKSDDDDGKKEDVKEGHFTEKPPKPGKQPMTGVAGGSKMGKSRLPKGPMDDSIKGDALKGKGTSSSKAFKEKPKKAPDYKDGVDHKAGGIKNRSKAG